MTLYNVDEDICYQESIENDSFVIINEVKVAFIRYLKLYLGRSHLMTDVGVL